MIRITPEVNRIWCEYLCVEPISHHDPGQVDQSNFSMFRRQRRWTTLDAAGETVNEAHINGITDAHPVPVEIHQYFEDEPLARFVAICITKMFITAYGRGEGTGLFSGPGRYRRLEARLEQTASRAYSLKSYWSVLTQEMKAPAIPGPMARTLLELLVQPSAFGTDVLYQFAKYSQLIVMLAREWVENERLADPEYAEKAKKPATTGEVADLVFEQPADPATELSIAIPVHSGNDIRHDIRQSAMYHLLNTLDITFDDTLPLHVRTLLENGGALAGSAPDNAFARAQSIMANYPHLGLLGGCMPNYMLGESRLQAVGAYLKGRENNDALAEIGIHSDTSVVDLLDRYVLTRHGKLTGTSSLPYEFEVIQPGAKLYVRFQFHPFITALEVGAFAAAMETFIDSEGAIGGQTAQGFGRVKVDYIEKPVDLDECKNAYNDYLNQNYEYLRNALINGDMGAED